MNGVRKTIRAWSFVMAAMLCVFAVFDWPLVEALHTSQASAAMEKRLYVWGSGGTGQLGLGTEVDYDLPQRWDNAQQLELESVVSGGCHSAGIRGDGRLFLWGLDNRGQLRRSKPARTQSVVTAPIQPVAFEHKTKLVACGWWHTLAVVSNDSTGDQAFSWGSNDNLQLGRDKSSAGDEVETALMVQLPLRLQVLSIACGWKHSLLATVDGRVFSWGSGRHGQLGLGSAILKTESPKRIEGLDGAAITDVCCGWEHSVFRSSSGEVFTCGNNRHGQLGVPTSASTAVESSQKKRKQVVALPARVADPRDKALGLRTVQVGCGWHFVLCLTEDGDLTTWGKGSHGQLGLGELENAGEPQVVTFTHAVRQIACGSEHSMVVTSSGDLYTCGWGEHGNLGHGDKTTRSSLEKVDFFADANLEVLKVAAGGAVSIAVTRDRHQ